MIDLRNETERCHLADVHRKAACCGGAGRGSLSHLVVLEAFTPACGVGSSAVHPPQVWTFLADAEQHRTGSEPGTQLQPSQICIAQGWGGTGDNYSDCTGTHSLELVAVSRIVTTYLHSFIISE